MKIQTQCTEINGLKVCYSRAGDSTAPPLVFLHAWGARLGNIRALNGMKPIIKALSKDFFVIAPEHPGLLRSKTPISDTWSFETYATTLAVLLERLSIPKPIIIGNSFGGSIATIYAHLYPENISSLVLIDSGISREYTRTPRMQRYAKKYVRVLTSKYIPFFVKKIWLWYHTGKPLRLLTASETRNEIQFAENFDRTFSVEYNMITLPVGMLWGTQDTVVHPISQAREVAARIPNCTFTEYPGTVDTVYKRPKYMADLIKKQLAKIMVK